FRPDRPRNDGELRAGVARPPFRGEHNPPAPVNPVAKVTGIVDVLRNLCAIFQGRSSPQSTVSSPFLPFCPKRRQYIFVAPAPEHRIQKSCSADRRFSIALSRVQVEWEEQRN